MDQTESVLDLAVQLAREAGGIQRSRYGTELVIDSKSTPNDLVTEVDRACEALIVERLNAERPGDSVVAEEGGEVVFVEVKTRRGARCGTPEEAVDARKRRRLARLAQAFLQQRRLEDRPCRFDVIAVLWETGRRPRVDHFRHAFTLDAIGPEPGLS